MLANLHILCWFTSPHSIHSILRLGLFRRYNLIVIAWWTQVQTWSREFYLLCSNQSQVVK